MNASRVSPLCVILVSAPSQPLPLPLSMPRICHSCCPPCYYCFLCSLRTYFIFASRGSYLLALSSLSLSHTHFSTSIALLHPLLCSVLFLCHSHHYVGISCSGWSYWCLRAVPSRLGFLLLSFMSQCATIPHMTLHRVLLYQHQVMPQQCYVMCIASAYRVVWRAMWRCIVFQVCYVSSCCLALCCYPTCPFPPIITPVFSSSLTSTIYLPPS